MAETVVRNQLTAFITDAHSRGLEKLDLDLLLLMDSEQLCSSISPNFFQRMCHNILYPSINCVKNPTNDK